MAPHDRNSLKCFFRWNLDRFLHEPSYHIPTEIGSLIQVLVQHPHFQRMIAQVVRIVGVEVVATGTIVVPVVIKGAPEVVESGRDRAYLV